MSLQDRNFLVDFTLQNKQVAEAQKAVLILWLQDIFTHALDLFQSQVVHTCWQGSVLACSTSHKQLPAHGIYLGNWISYVEFSILVLRKAFRGVLCENVT